MTIFEAGKPAVSDQISALTLTALTRAAAAPAGLPPLTARKHTGLFPNTVAGRAALQRCQDQGWLHVQEQTARITDAGREHLLQAQNPRAVLEDLVRVVESRQRAASELAVAAQSMAEELGALRQLAAVCLPNVAASRLPRDEGRHLATQVLAALRDRIASTGEDCPLPDLYRRLSGPPTLGEFHDALRELRRRGRLLLHPWTGPLYTLPEPEFALLSGHEVTYYASLPTAAGAAVPALETAVRGLP